MKKELQDLREDYTKGVLDVNDLPGNPINAFELWFKEYTAVAAHDANAMTLATTDINNRPSARIVLLKGIDKGGFEFYTNYDSAKGLEIKANFYVSLLFFWPELQRQVRVEGIAEKMTREESEAYFKSRPLESKWGAWASPQSKEIESREVLQQKFLEIKTRFGNTVPLPDNWGGYRVIPNRMEFWQGRSSRLHDRVIYEDAGNKQWIKKRLAP